jgi:predicted NAD/FAD-dependent oxidoreductase
MTGREGRDAQVAVIGAGMAGLTAAHFLHRSGRRVTVFDKARGVGGRMSTRHAPGNRQFDHGAPFFTARSGDFREVVESWVRDGVVAPWKGTFRVIEGSKVREFEELNRVPHYVGVPSMNAVCKHLLAGFEIRTRTRVASLDRVDAGWRVRDDKGDELGRFDAVIVTAPAPQTAEILEPAPGLAERIRSVRMSVCWALMAAFERPLGLSFDAAFFHEVPIAWAARNSSKPGRDASQECWVLQGSQDWSLTHLEIEPEEARDRLLDALWEATRHDPVAPAFAEAHRWRYALAAGPLGDPFLLDSEERIGACGDWCTGPGVEGAYRSGKAIAEVLGNLL